MQNANGRVWCDSSTSVQNVNLNQTAIHSENPLKGVEIKSTNNLLVPLGLGSSTDFLLSENLQFININRFLNCSSIIKNDPALSDGKILPPRHDTSPACSSTYQPSDQTVRNENQIAGPPEVVPLRNVSNIPETEYLEPSEKDKQVQQYIAQPVHVGSGNGLFEILDEFGIDFREETVVSHSCFTEEVTKNPENYIQGKVIYGGRQALEKLARDTNKLKTGTHGVITNPKYEFLWKPTSSLKKVKVLGRGGNGTVELCRFNNMEFVTKTIYRDFRPSEVLFTNSLSHEFIVKSHGLIIRNGSPQIIMDYAGDNLLHYGLSRNVEEGEIWNITYQILEALDYLHSKQIRHFDVKPENIILLEDSSGHKTLKLADFGGACLFTEEVDCLSWTPAYMSPEMDQFFLKRQFPRQQLITTSCGEISEKCDVYSLALSILFLYVKGHVLIKHVTKGMQAMVGPEKADVVSMKIVILNAQKPGLAESLIPIKVGKEMKTILIGMLKGNVDERLTARQAMELMTGLSSQCGIVEEPKRIMRRKSKSTDARGRHVQTTKTPRLVIVTLDKTGKKVGEYENPTVGSQFPQTNIQRNTLGYRSSVIPTEDIQTPGYNTLETEEQQRPLRDLNIDLQLNIILEQLDSVKDEKMRQVIDEENRPLLTRLVKRKLKDKVSGEIAFKMTKLREELDSSSTCSSDSGKENTVSLTCQENIITTPSEPEVMEYNDGPGNIPNFDMFLDI